MKKIISLIINSLGYDIRKKNRGILEYVASRYPVKTIIDIGANQGQFARQALAVFPDANIYSFEPLPSAYSSLKTHADGKRVTAFNYALGDKNAKVKMHIDIGHEDSSSMLNSTVLCQNMYPFSRNQAEAEVEQITLDAAVPALNIPLKKEVLVKMDVQGYEDRVISGGMITLAAAKICIAEVCLAGLYEGQASFEKLYSQLNGLGFKYGGNLEQVQALNGGIVYIDAIFIKE